MGKHWTEQELNILKDQYNCKTPKELSKILNRTYTAIRDKAENLKLRSYKTWSEKDIQILKENYEYGNWNFLTKALKRKKAAITAYARKFKLVKRTRPNIAWAEKDLWFLKENYAIMPNRELSLQLNKSISALTTIAYSLDLHKNNGPKRNQTYCLWSKKDVTLLKKWYKRLDVKSLAILLRRSTASIHHKLQKYGMKLLSLPQYTSSLEANMKKILKELKIPFEHNVKIDRWQLDFLIDKKIILEMHGSYWHGDNRFFSDKTNKQLCTIEKDFRKKKYFLSKGYKYIVVWEYDFYNDIEKIKTDLRAVLNSNIQEYDSAKTVNTL
jgi:G:T-mismatch repair DNA endonuclease (very short patch repair protein)